VAVAGGALPPPPFLGVGPPVPVDRAPLRLLLWALAGGLALDVGLRGGPTNLVVAVAVAVVVAGLVTDGRLARTGARVAAGLALLPAAGLVLRASPWLATLNLAAVAGLVGLAVLLSRSGSVFDTTPTRLLRRGASALWRALAAPAALRPLTGWASGLDGGRAVRVGLALVVAVPVLLVVTVLLASADPVFAELVTPDVDPVPFAGHLVLVVLGGSAVLATLAAALGDGRDDRQGGGFGVAETVTMLGLAAAVLGLFVVSQLVALTDAGRRLVEEAGLTPAEYARSGFFQLCWASAVIVGFLGLVGFVADRSVMARPVVRALAALVPLLASGLVVVSLRRMALYDEAFGLTMLRLWVVGAALWMGAVLVMIALRNAGVGGERAWVLGGAASAALVLVVAANLLDPEAFVVRHNVARAEDGAELDLPYLAGLSDDAVPALVDELGEGAFLVGADHRVGSTPARCDDGVSGVAALNVAVARAADARREACVADG
jgi:hypothetical protein